MSDIDELKSLVTQQVREAAAAQARQDQLIAAAQARQDALIAELTRARIAHPGAPADGDADAAATAADAARVAARTEKFNKLAIALRKSFKVKEYKDSGAETIKEWLLKFNQEITTLKRYSGITDDLSRDEWVELFKDKLDHQVVKRVNTTFAAKSPDPWNWNEVTQEQLLDIMKQEYGKKTIEVSEVLL